MSYDNKLTIYMTAEQDKALRSEGKGRFSFWLK